MIRFKFFFLLSLLWGLGLAAVSYSSGYNIRKSVSAVDFEIATMLTPIGIGRILSAEDHWLMPYYSQITGPLGWSQHPGFLAWLILFFLISIVGLIFLRRRLNAPR